MVKGKHFTDQVDIQAKVDDIENADYEPEPVGKGKKTKKKKE